MKNSRWILIGLMVATAGFCHAAGQSASVKAAPKAGTTLDDLMAAYSGESNAQAAYVAYAKKAESEGYLKVAHLFRAAAQSEGIHAANHAKVIRKMKGIPKAGIETPVVGTTRENLKKALAGETREYTTLYPGFIKTAETEKNTKAVKVFNWALKVEQGHAALYREALDNLKDWKADGRFYVCQECGNTVQTIDFKRCPVCFEPRGEFKEIK